jgi:hypothetical protein
MVTTPSEWISGFENLVTFGRDVIEASKVGGQDSVDELLVQGI